MLKQIICTIIILVGISIYSINKNKEELSGTTVVDQQYCEGQKAGESRRLNTMKWIFNKSYRRGYIWGIKNEKF